jgi:hypothetical protein
MKANRIIRSVVMAAAVCLLAASVAQAAIPDANGVYTACYDKIFQRMRLIDAEAGETCKRIEILITWNKAGEKGDPGDALKPDGPCFNDNENRYQDCGNGTVTDTVTGLIWLKQADCLPVSHWAEANNAAGNLEAGMCGLTDNSSPGDWRLPTNEEWRATVARPSTYMHCTNDGVGAPTLTDTTGSECFIEVDPSLQPFTGVRTDIFYWSSSVSEISGGFGGVAVLSDGTVGTVGKTDFDRAVWPVRSGR